MNNNYDFILTMIGIQGIEIISTDVNNGIFEMFAASTKDFAICPRCRRIIQKQHDSRYQPIKHLLIRGIDMTIMFNKRRYVCDCDPKHPFDEPIDFVRRYQRQTIVYEKYVTIVTHKNTIKNRAELCGISEGRCQRIYNFYANKVPKSRELEPPRLC